ncbi:hypothetical protein JCM10212_000914 [Sporobolomyces blumeae]
MAQTQQSRWVDVRETFDAALGDLNVAQLVQLDKYSMTDLMSAIEINDPRTDSYLAARKIQPDVGTSSAFDPSRPLSPRDVVCVIDELMRLEATFQDGQPLMSTLWHCNYFRPESLEAVSAKCGTDAGDVDSLEGVLRAMLLGVLKTNEIVWEELCKGQVYEHEDVHLATSSLTFNNLMAACFPPLVPSWNPLAVVAPPPADPNQAPIRTVSVDNVLQLLDGALKWLQEEEARESIHDEGVLQDLVSRVTLRIDLLYMFALLTSPAHTSPSQIQHHLNRISSYLPLLPTSSAPMSTRQPSSESLPPHVVSAFRPSPSIPLLPTSQPPRIIEPFSVGKSYDANVRDLVKELSGLCDVWSKWSTSELGERPGATGGWGVLREYARNWARTASCPYVRSLHQTVLTSTPAHLFSTSALLHLSVSFLSTTTSIPPSFFLQHLYTIRLSETSYSSPAHLVLGWLERLASELSRTTLPLAGQNRSRQHRWIRKSVLEGRSAWSQLVDESDRVVPVMVELARSAAIGAQGSATTLVDEIEKVLIAVRAHFADLVLEALLSGFEPSLGLLPPSEHARVWFVVERLSSELEEMWSDLGEVSEGGYVKARRAEVRSLKEMARGSFVMSTLFPPRPVKYSSPFLPSLSIDDGTADRERYRQRFDWIGAGQSVGAIYRNEVSYGRFVEEQRRLDQLSRDDLVREGQAAFERAIEALTEMANVSLADRGATVRPDLALRTLASLRRTAFANQSTLASSLARPDSSSTPSSSTSWDHAWFPTWTTTSSS